MACAADSPAGVGISGVTILRDLKCFREMGSMLMVAAHPDDENTQLIAYMSRGRYARMAYLSVTRGDGGQNLLGPELGPELGVARTQELLAARRIDLGRQFFTRAIDFGFSKDYRNTLNVWDEKGLVSDIVRVIREFRPDVMVTRFSVLPSNTHGHHTASAVLALEAFKLAGDPKAFPEQLDKLTVWQPKRIMQNGGGGGGASVVRMDDSGTDPLTGETFSLIARQSRAMHKTQGFGNIAAFGGRGGPGGGGESFVLLGGDPATKDVFDGVDTTWARVPGGAEIAPLADALVANFNKEDPAASVPAILAVRTLVNRLASDPVVDEKKAALDHILAECVGLKVQTTIPKAEVVPGETLNLHHSVTVTSSVPVRWISVHYLNPDNLLQFAPIDLHPGDPAQRDDVATIASNAPLTQPYWLAEDHPPGMFQVSNPALIGRPESPPAFPIEYVFQVGGQTLVIPDQPVQVITDPNKGTSTRRLDIIPPVSLKLPEVALFAPGATKMVTLQIDTNRPAEGTVGLIAPAGWKVSQPRPFKFAAAGDSALVPFTITAPAQIGSVSISAQVTINGRVYGNQRIVISYDHIPPQLLQPPARLKAVCLDVSIKGKNVGYIAGAGDSTVESLQQLGYTVTELSGADLTPEKLQTLDALVFGVRAFDANVRKDLAEHMPAVFAFIRNGGNVIVQYNRPDGLNVPAISPYSLRLSSDRVTDPNAAITFLAPDHPVMNTPNKITQEDFKGWVQERGTYFPNQWDSHFTPILACNDQGEAPMKGELLIAQYGKGYFVYTGIGFFRQLPAGVSGAYRLFANLVSLGK